MTYVIAILVLCAFAIALRASGITATARAGGAAASAAWATLQDSSASDDEKERASRRAAAALIICAGRLLVRLAFAIAPAVAVGYVSVKLGLTSIQDLLRALSSWPFVVLACLASVTLIGA